MANLIQISSILLSFYANTVINRRKSSILWIIICLIDIIPYYMLNAYWGIFASLWYLSIKTITLFLHKEEKIVQPIGEAIILAIPIVFIGIAFYKIENNPFYIVLGIVNAINSMLFIVRKDIHRYMLDATFDIGYITYDFYVLNFSSAIRYIIEIIIFICNIYRLHKNSEGKYYTDKTNVIEK